MEKKPPEIVALEREIAEGNARARRFVEEIEQIPPGVTPFDVLGVAVEIGDFAYTMLDGLSRPVEQDASDQSADARVLSDFFMVEHLVPMIEVPQGRQDDAVRQGQINKTLLALHVATPFNEAERDWLGRMVSQSSEEAGSYHLERLHGYIEQREDRIIMGGLRQVVSGRDLLRHWLSWRNETDEYAGQGTLDATREALARLINLTQPDRPLPESYQKLSSLGDDALSP